MSIAGYIGRSIHRILQGMSPPQELRAALALRSEAHARSRLQQPLRRRQLLVDVSTLVSTDAKTGIQRVSKAILKQWLAQPPEGFDVRPVRASKVQTFQYCDAGPWNKESSIATAQGDVEAGEGDIFVSLDLTANILPHHHKQLERWKLAGATIFIVVYDLLPTLRPEWFTDSGAKAQRRWLRTLSIYADGAACISKSVAAELSAWLDKSIGPTAAPIAITSFPLGADFEPAPVADSEIKRSLAALGTGTLVLMVGTVEPRKGYALALSAFEQLWRAGSDTKLVLVGKPGWKVDALVAKLRMHPEAGKHLHWIENGSDELLIALYRNCSGLLMASEGEGFGLPIIEAARYGLPVLARDLPVFREIADDAASYFEATQPDELAREIAAWVKQIENGRVARSAGKKVYSWEESAQGLLAAVGITP